MATGKLQARDELSEVVNELTDADFVFEITATPPQSAMLSQQALELIEEALQASIRPFAPTAAGDLQKVAVLEETSKNSVSIWFNFHPSRSASSDEFASRADPALLKFASQGLLTIISWMSGRSQPRMSDLQQAIRVLTWGTCATSSARPAEPSSVDLMRAVAGWQRVKHALHGKGFARVIMQQGSADLDLEKSLPELTHLLEKRLVNSAVELIFVVELPDYNNSGEWRVKHGDTRFTAKCRECDSLRRFYSRELDIRPGDGLHCIVEFATAYGPDSELVEEVLSIVDVLEVLPARAPAADESRLQRSEPTLSRAVEFESAT